MTRLRRASGITSIRGGSTCKAPSPPRNTTCRTHTHTQVTNCDDTVATPGGRGGGGVAQDLRLGHTCWPWLLSYWSRVDKEPLLSLPLTVVDSLACSADRQRTRLHLTLALLVVLCYTNGTFKINHVWFPLCGPMHVTPTYIHTQQQQQQQQQQQYNQATLPS